MTITAYRAGHCLRCLVNDPEETDPRMVVVVDREPMCVPHLIRTIRDTFTDDDRLALLRLADDGNPHGAD